MKFAALVVLNIGGVKDYDFEGEATLQLEARSCFYKLADKDLGIEIEEVKVVKVQIVSSLAAGSSSLTDRTAVRMGDSRMAKHLITARTTYPKGNDEDGQPIGKLYKASLEFDCPSELEQSVNPMAFKSWKIERQNDIRRGIESKLGGNTSAQRAGAPAEEVDLS